jgi:probable rRNA maturation factor
MPEFGELCLGDVVICLDKVEEQAKEFGHSFERELIYLFVHSLLHLLGYDHMEEDEKQEMRQREEAVMSAIDLNR